MDKTITRRPISETLALNELHPLLQRIYSARGVTTLQEINYEFSSLLPFSSLLNIEQAVARLIEALANQQHILIVGDFDTDGATSTALAVSSLKAMGAQQVDFLVPNRFKYGYGLTPEIVEVAAKKKPDLIITVDNGIASHAGVLRAKALGIDVLITDHHLPSQTIPEDCIIINPNQQGDVFPSKCLAGVGVIFYVMLALRAGLQQHGWFESQNIPCPNMAQFLDLVALGTIADLVMLDQNNRILVRQGLRRIRQGHARPGILALLNVAGREAFRLTESDLGYVIAPRLNAAGRLDDMSLGISCLLASDLSIALTQAQELDHLNQERRALESQMQKEAFDIVSQLDLDTGLPFGLCLYHPSWHQGIVGLVASRIKEKFHRPVIAFAKVDDHTLKGSARSIEGLHIRDVLDAIAKEHPDLLSKFGGHAMAAGLSISLVAFETFREVFAKKVNDILSAEQIAGKIETDGELALDEFTLDNARLIQNEGPWGQGFPQPIFDGNFEILDQQIVGKHHLRLSLKIANSSIMLNGIAFRANLNDWPDLRCRNVRAVYRLDVNEFNGRQKLQLIIEGLQKL